MSNSFQNNQNDLNNNSILSESEENKYLQEQFNSIESSSNDSGKYKNIIFSIVQNPINEQPYVQNYINPNIFSRPPIRNEFFQYPSLRFPFVQMLEHDNYNNYNFNNYNFNNYINLNSDSNLGDDDSEENIYDNNYDRYYYPIQIGANIDEITSNIGEFLNNEKQKIKEEKEKLLQSKRTFKKFQNEFSKQYKNKKEEMRKILKIKNEKLKETDIIELNIGGTTEITTTRGTLLKYQNSVLSLCFNGTIKLPKKNGKYFIDRNGQTFILMLHYLRNSTLPLFNNINEEKDFFSELNFWKIPLIRKKTQFEFDPKWCASTFILDKTRTLLKKNSSNHGVVFIKPGLNSYNPYLEFKVKISIPCKNNSHLFLGLVDNTKYIKPFLLSTFWKDSPCAYYWDAWNGKLVKTDENGNQIISKFKYGCEFDDYETKFAFEYNQEKRTLGFYKNDIYLGVAFDNVPPNLTPAFEIWFEKGDIKISGNMEPQEKFYL